MSHSRLQQSTTLTKTPLPACDDAVVPGLARTRHDGSAHDLLQQTLLQRYVPVSFLVDRKLELKDVEGPVERYRLRATKEEGAAVSILGRQGLREQLREAILEADADRQEVVADAGLPCADGDRSVAMRVAPLAGPLNDQGLFLVTLLEAGAADEASPAGGTREPFVLDLATELEVAREQLVATGHQFSLAREKIRALEEELFQVDDEYQAMCEGLKTACAQLETENQRLRDANQALQDKTQALECQANDLDNLLNSTDVATLFLGADLCIRWYTPAMTALMPLRPWDLGRHADRLAPQFSGRDLATDAVRVLRSLEPLVAEVRSEGGRWYIRRIVPYRTRDAHIDGVAVTFTDITERKRSEDEITHRATHDALTDLANRATFHRELALARVQAAARHSRLAVLMLDLDRFKRVNDNYGHAVGDQLLIEMSRRLCSCVRAHDLVARLGGDEFAILIPEVEDDESVATFARRVLRRLAEPCRFGTIELRPRASVGITIFPDDGGNCDQLLCHADRALYMAKETRQQGWAIFGSEMRLAEELPQALERDEFELDYQPIVALAGSANFGAEALLRWNHPIHGRLLPNRFLPLAERQGLMPAITRWVLDHACRQLAVWQDRGLCPGKLAVNVTDEYLLQAGVVPILEDLLQRRGTAPGNLVLEIHERTLLESADGALLPVLERLRGLGFGIALDDFGVGHASLIHLRLAPVGIVKIDREFLRDQGTSPDNMTIIAAMVELCRRLDKTIIVEGIETKAQQLRVMAAGCPWGQGFWYARPMNAATMTDHLLNEAALPAASRGSRRPKGVIGVKSA